MSSGALYHTKARPAQLVALVWLILTRVVAQGRNAYLSHLGLLLLDARGCHNQDLAALTPVITGATAPGQAD